MEKNPAPDLATTYGGKHNNSPEHRQLLSLTLVLIAVAILVIPRFMHLDADPVSGFIPDDIGYQIDEGYKTFAPKNLHAFGKTIWHPSDTYSGWMNYSPVTQWPYYYSFKTFGLELKNARVITAIYSTIFLAIALVILTNRYSLTLATTGALLLASEAALFYFSRSALFEIALVLFIYSGVLLTTRIQNDKPLRAVALLTVFMLVTTLIVKRSAIVYFAPPLVACSLLSLFGKKRSHHMNAAYLLVLILISAALAYYTRGSWIKYIDLNNILNYPKAFMLNPMPDLSPLALLLGYSCILHLLLIKPESIVDSLYRLTLTAIVVGAPLIFSLFEKHPPRYFAAIIPACLLLAIEWLYLKPWKLPIRWSYTITQKLVIAITFIIFSMFLLRAFEILVLRNAPFTIGEDPGIDKSMLLKLLPLFLAGLYGMYYVFRDKTVRLLGLSIPALIATSIATGVYAQADFLLNPMYESQTVRTKIRSTIKTNESIAGDWAAFFTSEDTIRSFYMSKGINFPYPGHIDLIRPNYFLNSNTPFDEKSLAAITLNESITIGSSTYLGSYMDRDILLYQLSYKEIHKD